MKILVAEDDGMILRLIQARLEKNGYTVVTASNGEIAYAKLQSEDFDLLITDIMMPFITGLELINTMKNVLKRNTPVIVISNVHLLATIQEAFRLGADDFITKPFSPNELTLRVEKILDKFN